MPSIYELYKKHYKKIKYSLYIEQNKFDEIFHFLKNSSEKNNYLITLIFKSKNILKQGIFIDYDSGILILKNLKNQTIYEYIKNYYLFIENLENFEKEDQMEKYAPIIIDFDLKEEKKKKKLKEKYKKSSSSMRQTLETLLEDMNEEEDQKNE